MCSYIICKLYNYPATLFLFHTQGLQSGYFKAPPGRFTCYPCTTTAADGEH